MLRQRPIIVLLGATATGKTRLSLELAQRFNGQIISADSMQVYKELDITTAKATPAERAAVPHHMLNVCDIGTRDFTVIDYRNRALPIVERLLADHTMPIIVGGTNYYIESLLWHVLLAERGKRAMSGDEITRALGADPYDPANPRQLYDLLVGIDAELAKGLHLNDDRRIRNALETYITTGRTKSEHFARQRSLPGSSDLGGPLRFRHVLGFWLRSDLSALDARIDRRIDSMVARGMLPEIRRCYDAVKADGIDTERGIMQTIGFKEFLPYLTKYDDRDGFDAEITALIRGRGGGLSGQKRFVVKSRISEGLKELERCLDVQRDQTKRYSRDQIQWIRNRFLADNGRCVPPIYELDTTNVDGVWERTIFSKAEHIIQSYMDGAECEHRPMDRIRAKEEITFECAVCQRQFVGDYTFERHMKSQTHKKQLKLQTKQKKREEKLKKRRSADGLASFRAVWSRFVLISKKIASFLRRS